MRQIADWLEKLGMSEYARCFAENRIDFSVLPELTDQHLKDLGLPLGDRLKMLRAIRELSGAVPVAPQAEPGSRDTAERVPLLPTPARRALGASWRSTWGMAFSSTSAIRKPREEELETPAIYPVVGNSK